MATNRAFVLPILRQQLFVALMGRFAERIKAVFITDEDVFGYNATPDVLNEIELDDCLYSRIEIIADSIDDLLECQLLAGVEPQH